MDEKAIVDALVANASGGILLVGSNGKTLAANATAELLRERPEIRGLIDAARAGSREAARAIVEVRRGRRKEAAEFFDCRAFAVSCGESSDVVLVVMREATVEREFGRMKEDFFHAVAHDLRGPLSIIDGMIYFMRKIANLEERPRRYLDMAEQASRRLGEMVADILDISNFESGVVALSPSSFPVASLLESSRESCRPAAEEKKIRVELESSGAGELTADRKLMERAVLNLVGNAIKFTPEGGRVVLGATGGQDEIEFYVQDTGPGVPAHEADAVFEKFVKIEREGASRSGCGLGLAICRHVVGLHRGRLWVESRDGAGGRFAFRVPRKPPPAA